MKSATATRRQKTKLAQIEAFLREKRIAVVGASRNKQDYSRLVMRELQMRGYEVVPVNPNTAEIEGAPCVARVQDVKPAVAAAFVFTPPEKIEEAVRDCIAAGVRQIWIRRSAPPAVDLCNEKGISVVAGECPLMFLPNSQFVHRFHGMINKVVGVYPR